MIYDAIYRLELKSVLHLPYPIWILLPPLAWLNCIPRFSTICFFFLGCTANGIWSILIRFYPRLELNQCYLRNLLNRITNSPGKKFDSKMSTLQLCVEKRQLLLLSFIALSYILATLMKYSSFSEMSLLCLVINRHAMHTREFLFINLNKHPELSKYLL